LPAIINPESFGIRGKGEKHGGANWIGILPVMKKRRKKALEGGGVRKKNGSIGGLSP